MNIIVAKSLNKNAFVNYKIVDTFAEASTLYKTNEYKSIIIIKDFDDNSFNAGMYLTELTNLGAHFLYISEEQDTTVTMLVNGAKGTCLTDEFYFDSEEDLNVLLESIESSQDICTDLAASSLTIIKDFMSAFVRGDSRLNVPLYLESVNSAIVELDSINQLQNTKIETIGATAIDVFNNANNIINKMENNRKTLQKQISELQSLSSTSPVNNRASLSNNINQYPTIQVLTNAKVLVLREVTPTRYLTSLALGYYNYLKTVKHKRVKLVFIHLKNYGMANKYSKFTSINPTNYTKPEFLQNDILAIDTPQRELVNKVLKSGADYYIVVDRLYNNQCILSGQAIKVNSVNSASDIQRFALDAAETVTSVTNFKNSLFYVPTIKEYPSDENSRVAYYLNVLEDGFKKFDGKLGIS